MSLAAHLINDAASRAAHESFYRLNVTEWTASKLVPVAVSLILHGLRRRSRTVLGAAALSFTLRRYNEDVFIRERRLGDADMRARGDWLIDRSLGRHRERAVRVISDLALIDPDKAAMILAMTAAGIVSALSKTRRALRLGVLEMQGVVKSEAEGVDNADPDLVREIRAWVFAPPFYVRVWRSAIAFLRPQAGPEMALAD
ncbi:MAG: DUF937 domain-containing protein [Amphiplicatus sp.]